MATIDDEIRTLEESLLTRAIRSSAARLDALISDDFVEFGSSGRVYNKSEIIATLTQDPDLPATTLVDFRVLVLGQDAVLATYRSGRSLRSSIWRRENDTWRVLFHQGTRPAP
jgi:hypothetical protein